MAALKSEVQHTIMDYCYLHGNQMSAKKYIRHDGNSKNSYPKIIKLSSAASQSNVCQWNGVGWDMSNDATYWGHVDGVFAERGIVGWVASKSPLSPPGLTLHVGELKIAETVPRQYREDIWMDCQLDYQTGFSFDVEKLLILLAKSNLSLSDPVRVTITGTNFDLNSSEKLTLGRVLSVLQQKQVDTFMDETLSGLPPQMVIDRLLRHAHRLMMRPRRNDQSNKIGVIEWISYLPGNNVLLGGWWSSLQPKNDAAVIIDGGSKYPAAISCMTYIREDLPDNNCGFIGLLRTQEQWWTTDDVPKFLISLGDKQMTWMEARPAIRQLSHTSGLSELMTKLSSAEDSFQAEKLTDLVKECLPWDSSSQADQLGIEIGIDSYHLAPNFGIFVSGWIVSPLGSIIDIAARMGDSGYFLDPTTLSFHPRNDLKSAFPHMVDRMQYAGFSCVLRGQAPVDASKPWLLRIRFNGNVTILHRMPMSTVRIVDNQFDLALLDNDRIGLASAPWMMDFVESTFGGEAKPENFISYSSSKNINKVLIQVLPEKPVYLRVAFDGFDRMLSALDCKKIEVVIVLPKTAPQGLVNSWINTINENYPRLGLSVCTLPIGATAWQVLPSILHRIGVEKFVFSGPDVLLTEAGGKMIMMALGKTLSTPLFFPIEHLSGQNAAVNYDAQAFAWRTEEFKKYFLTALPVIGGFFRKNTLDHDRKTYEMPSSGQPYGLRLCPVVQGKYSDVLNQRVVENFKKNGTLL